MHPKYRAGARLIAFDVGSNTVRGMAARMREDGALVVTGEDFRTTALGRGLTGSRRMERPGIEATADFVAGFLARYGPADEVWCVGTAASRDADNADELRRALAERAGVQLEVISPDTEAELSYLGAIAAACHPPGPHPAVADIGGRSTELVATEAGLVRSVSLPIGARSITELHLPSECPGAGEIAAARAAADRALQAGADIVAGAGTVIAVGGTACSAALLADCTWCMSRSQLTGMRERLCAMTARQRRAVMAFDPERAEIICGGLVILEALAAAAPGSELHISPGGVREGLLMRNTGATRLVSDGEERRTL